MIPFYKWKYRRRRQAAFQAIQDGSYFPFTKSKWLMNDKEFVFKAIEKEGDHVIQHMSGELRDDKAFALALLDRKHGQRNFLLLSQLSVRLQDDRDIVKLSIQSWGPSLEYASERLRDDKEIVLTAMRGYGSLEFASGRLKDDHDVVMEAISAISSSSMGARVGYVLNHASRRLQSDKEILTNAISIDPTAIEFAPPVVRDDERFMLEIVCRWGHLLEYASNRIKDMDHIVLKAVEQYEGAIQYVSTRLKKDKNFNLKILIRSGSALKFLPVELRTDKDIVLAALHNDPISLRYALGGLNQDRDCLIASGLWQQGYSQRKIEEKKKQQDLDSDFARRPRVVLSTRFALNPDSSTTATEFTLLFKSHPFFKEGDIVLYSPNDFDKMSCDPNWTRMEWPCRGTPETCKLKECDAVRTGGEPTTKSCWRYSFRYQLEEAKNTNGYMIQVIELKNSTDGGLEYELGNGQQIEAVMAAHVGVKVFRVFEPGYVSGGKIHYREGFTVTDIESLLKEIRIFLDADHSDMSPQDINCSLPTRLS